MSDLSDTVLKTAAEACGIAVAEAKDSKGETATEALQLAVWLLCELAGLSMTHIASLLERTEVVAEGLLRAAHSRRRRNAVWRAKGDRLLERLRDQLEDDHDEADAPEQLDLLAAVDNNPRNGRSTSWGFEGQHPPSYFAQLNERAVRAMAKGLAQEAEERESAA